MSRHFTVDWALSAGEDLRSIVGYLSRENQAASEKVFKIIRLRAASLKILPYRGRIVPELLALGVDRYREMIIPPYRLIYRIEGKRVFVAGLFDARRDLEDILIDRIVCEQHER